jgi:hypothetical protein
MESKRTTLEPGMRVVPQRISRSAQEVLMSPTKGNVVVELVGNAVLGESCFENNH